MIDSKGSSFRAHINVAHFDTDLCHRLEKGDTLRLSEKSNYAYVNLSIIKAQLAKRKLCAEPSGTEVVVINTI